MVDEDRRQFERLFHEHYDAVLAYAVVRADLHVAKDAVAQAFLVAWRRRQEVPDRPLPWLLAVTRRTLADQRRAAARQGNLATRLKGFADHRPLGDPADQVVEVDGALAAFRTLGDGDQEVLRLVAWDRLSPADAARVLGCSRPAFAVRLSRARRRLAAAMAASEAVEAADPFDLFPEPLEAP